MRSSTISGIERARRPRSKPNSRLTHISEHPDRRFAPREFSSGLIAGVDEAGRGPLAGPVVASAVILSPDRIPPGIKDSKQLGPARRERLYLEIMNEALAVGTGVVSAPAIDLMNILEATMLAMAEAVSSLAERPGFVLVDGTGLPDIQVPAASVIGGDSKCISIAAASIVAKVTRDRFMERMDAFYPRYRFHVHKGYGTRGHIDAIRRYGPTRL
ncbi:MAG: ribonuclease HII, partial [bacterium]